jgi:hypothetical protein
MNGFITCFIYITQLKSSAHDNIQASQLVIVVWIPFVLGDVEYKDGGVSGMYCGLL